MKTDDLIKLMAEDAPVTARPMRALTLAIIGGAVFSGLLFFATLGPRPDIATASETWRFLFKFVVTLSLAATALIVVLRIGRPGLALSGVSRAMIVVPLLLAFAVLAEMQVVPSNEWRTRWIGANAHHCVTLIPMLSVGPLAAMIWAMRQGAPEDPGVAGLAAGLAAGGIAASFYAANCTDDSPLFVAFWYSLAIGVVALAGYLIGRRALRW